MRPSVRSALALACTLPACVTYRDRIVVVTQLTQIERNTTPEGVSAATAAPAAPAPSDTLTLSGTAPPRLDAPTMRAALDGFGTWIEAPSYGVVWIPDARLRGPDFVPYLTAGQWIPTRVGWYWQSEYAWGAIPFHYGRWVRFNGVWAWVPGSAFAPAWVDWRVGNGWAAWAPLAPEGADFAAAHMYCAAARLRGAGLRARTVVGPAAAGLFVETAPVRVSCAQGASCYAPGPPVPTAVATDVASLWAASQTVAREVGAAASARITIDPVGTPVDPPARIPDVPTVARVLNAATGTLRAADAPILHPQPASIAEGGPSSDVDPADASDGAPRLAITSAQAPVASGRTLTSVTAGSSSYSVIPARRITWSSTTPAAPAETAPRAVYPQRVELPQRIEMPPTVYERSVATPPPLAAPSFAPSTTAWRAPSGYVAPSYGVFPTGLPTTPYAVAGSTFGRPSFAPSYAPATPSVIAAPSAPVYAAPTMPSYAAPVISAAQAPVVPPSARGASFGRMMGVPDVIAAGDGVHLR